MIRLTITILVCLISSVVYGQNTIAVDLKRIEGIWPLWNKSTTYIEEYTTNDYHALGIPEAFLGSYKLYRLLLNPAQMLYYRYMNNLPISQGQYEAITRLDTTHLCPCDIKYDVLILTSIRDDQKYVIVDSDNNRNFTNNRIYEFRIPVDGMNPMEEWQYIAPTFEVQYEIYNGFEVTSKSRIIQLFPFVPHDTRNNFSVVVGLHSHYSGSFSIDDQLYDIALADVPLEGKISNPSIRIKSAQSRFNGLINGVTVIPNRLGDIVYFNDLAYKLDRVSPNDDTLYLSPVSNVESDKKIGFNVGEHIEDMELTSLTGDVIRLRAGTSQNRFTLLNFWGSWCGPCHTNMPDYASLTQRLASKNLRFIGVAVDNSENDAKEFIKEFDIDWPQTFVKLHGFEASSLVNKLRVHVFPSYILLDSNNKIITRASKSVNYSELIEILENIQ